MYYAFVLYCNSFYNILLLSKKKNYDDVNNINTNKFNVVRVHNENNNINVQNENNNIKLPNEINENN